MLGTNFFGWHRPRPETAHADKVIGRINDGREKIQGLDKGRVIGSLVDARIIGNLQPHQKPRIEFHRQMFHHPVQQLRTKFAGSARSPGFSVKRYSGFVLSVIKIFPQQISCQFKTLITDLTASRQYPYA